MSQKAGRAKCIVPTKMSLGFARQHRVQLKSTLPKNGCAAEYRVFPPRLCLHWQLQLLFGVVEQCYHERELLVAYGELFNECLQPELQ